MVLKKLGRGLDSLIEETQPVEDTPFSVDCASIAPNPYQPREELDEDAVHEVTAVDDEDALEVEGGGRPTHAREVTGWDAR